MGLIVWACVVAAAGPLIAIGAVVADAHHGRRPVTGRRLVIGGAIGGAVVIGATGLLIAAVPEGPSIAAPAAIGGGALFGAAVGSTAAGLRRLRRPARGVR